jgi:CheY-like chemotaxis protein/anti-sigma regulatory factor (Ser/Thr protein kinase)
LRQQVLQATAAGPRIRHRLTRGEDLYDVAFDCDQMRQALENIVANAVEAMPQGGVVHVHVENVAVADAMSSLIANGRHLKITIRDEGKGIDERELEKIFDPYYTTKSLGTQKGMGLGLSITHSIITKHNGHIAVESTPGKGTVVCVYLPVERTAREPVDIVSPAAAGLEKERVLIMDDETIVLEVAGEMLGRLGYDVERAGSGEEAIKRYASAIANGEPFDAVILDLTVKGGMGGREAMEHLMRVDPHVVAFLSSGYSEDPAIEDYKRYGFAGVIKKPYSVDLLAKSLSEGMG